MRRVCFYGPRSPNPPSVSSPRHLLQRPPSPALLQTRVLRTTASKGCPRPLQTPSPLNWSWTAHRIRHISPSAMTAADQTQTRGHAGHGHHHAHDNTYLLSSNKKDAGVRITRIGLYVNLGMAVGKGFGGYVFNSQGKFTENQKPHTPANMRQHWSPMRYTVLQISSATS
jgi:hypothetical protein